jgi:hypothetical protein
MQIRTIKNSDRIMLFVTPQEAGMIEDAIYKLTYEWTGDELDNDAEETKEEHDDYLLALVGKLEQSRLRREKLEAAELQKSSVQWE